jgi:mono/diheme cytochrome c family protein
MASTAILGSVGFAIAVLANDAIPTAPENPTLAKVYAVLDQHCAKCHQRGKTGDKQPAGDLDQVLALNQLAKSRHVVPGLPDASPLLIAIQTRMAPHVFPRGEGENAVPELSSDDLGQLRAWVSGLRAQPSPPSAVPRDGIVPPIQVGEPPETATERTSEPVTPPSPEASPQAAPTSGPLTLHLAFEKPRYVTDDVLIVRATPSAACHLTLIGIDPRGRATVLFPSDFEPNNRIDAGQTLELPKAGSGYRFRLSQKGRQTIVGLCSTTQKAPPGLTHDFERLRFTELGDYEAFVQRAWDAAIYGTEKSGDGTETRRPRRDRGNQNAPPAPSAPGTEARTAIEVVVE